MYSRAGTQCGQGIGVRAGKLFIARLRASHCETWSLAVTAAVHWGSADCLLPARAGMPEHRAKVEAHSQRGGVRSELDAMYVSDFRVQVRLWHEPDPS